MAKLTRKVAARLWVGLRKPNQSLVIHSFGDTILQEGNDGPVEVQESAEQKADAFVRSNQGAVLLVGAKSTEGAILIAEQKGM